VAVAPPQLIQDEIPRDLEKPRREFRRGLVSRSGFPNANEYLLRNILRFRFVSEHLRHRSYDPVLMRLDELLERFYVSLLDPLHPRQIPCRRRVGRWVD
jgi:hypothetical protein